MWRWIAGAGVLAAFVSLLRSEYERRQLSVEYFTIRSHKIKTPRTLIFLSDLHDNEFGFENTDLIKAIEREAPDAILIGGDMMVCKKDCSTDASLLLVKALAKKYPVYYGNGNHENRMNRKREVYGDLYDCYRKALKECGVILLSDDSHMLDSSIVINGMDLDNIYYKKRFRGEMEVDYVNKKLGRADTSKFQILLAHSPLFYDAYRGWGADLSLSGHFHGGTIRLPYLGGVMTPQYQFFLPWCAGDFELNGGRMIVSRGLGTHSINIRINNKPQLVVINLKG